MRARIRLAPNNVWYVESKYNWFCFWKFEESFSVRYRDEDPKQLALDYAKRLLNAECIEVKK